MKCALAALILASQALVASAAPQVELKTTAGTIVMDLNGDKAPKTYNLRLTAVSAACAY